MRSRFANAAPSYDSHATVQRKVALHLAERIAGLALPSRPRILEIGCGTGYLSEALSKQFTNADWTITDIAEPMVEATRARLSAGSESQSATGSTWRYLVADGEQLDPVVADHAGYDLICSSLAVQWFDDLNSGLRQLASHLAPGGYLAITTLADGTFAEWALAHEAAGVRPRMRRQPPLAEIGAELTSGSNGVFGGEVTGEIFVDEPDDGLHFLRGLKRIGAGLPESSVTRVASVDRPLNAGELRRVFREFAHQGATVSYHVALGLWQRREAATRRTQNLSAPRGVFVTGTDTGIGKTLVSAVLTRAWQADYWKPLQTGLADEPGDTETVAHLSGAGAGRLHPPAYALQASLSPWDAARLEACTFDVEALRLPRTEAPLVVEGAGGLYVPVTDDLMMIDLIAQWGLPVILAARSTLGTINHTLLSLEALRSRNIAVLGVILSGPASPGNKAAIERFGKVAVIAEIDRLPHVDAHVVAKLASGIPAFDTLIQGLPDTDPSRNHP